MVMTTKSRSPYHPTQSEDTKATVSWCILSEIYITVPRVLETQLDEKLIRGCLGADDQWNTFGPGPMGA